MITNFVEGTHSIDELQKWKEGKCVRIAHTQNQCALRDNFEKERNLGDILG